MKTRICILSTLTALLMGFQNCSDVSFDTVPVASESVTGEVLTNDVVNKIIEEKFSTSLKVTTAQSSMDIVFVVDNSGSMEEESAHVRNNILNFANSFSASNDARMIVVSRKGSTGQAVVVPDDRRFTHIDMKVDSHNALSLLDSLWNGTHINSGTFLNAWRPGVPKAIVIVSDDESNMSAEVFKSRMPEEIAEDIAVYHSIVAVSAADSPCMENVGAIYHSLSQETGGEIFNICQTDWTSIFSELAAKIEARLSTISKTRFTVSQAAVKEVLYVKVDDVELDASKYSVVENVVRIKESVFSGDVNKVYSVLVKYKYE